MVSLPSPNIFTGKRVWTRVLRTPHRTLFELMDFEKISEVHKTFVDYFTAHDFSRMKATWDTSAKMAGNLMSRSLPCTRAPRSSR